MEGDEVPVHPVERYPDACWELSAGSVQAGSSGRALVSRKEGQIQQVIPGSFQLRGECSMRSQPPSLASDTSRTPSDGKHKEMLSRTKQLEERMGLGLRLPSSFTVRSLKPPLLVHS